VINGGFTLKNSKFISSPKIIYMLLSGREYIYVYKKSHNNTPE
jgi:hypothetical protein